MPELASFKLDNPHLHPLDLVLGSVGGGGVPIYSINSINGKPITLEPLVELHVKFDIPDFSAFEALFL